MPGRKWPEVKGWWARAALFNGLQAGVVFFMGQVWHGAGETFHLWNVDAAGPIGGALIGYLTLTFVFYWWHRARHEVPFLWRWFHQLHHSPQRLEIITSFYKHPMEVLANGLLSAVIMYVVLNLSPEAAMGASLLGGLAELFYHWNVKTPHWIGYIIQRPESHCAHHETGVHQKNYGDLALWDMMFGTFYNPPVFDGACGFGDDEDRIDDMLVGRDVTEPRDVPYRGRLIALTVLGMAGMAGSATGSPAIKAIAAATAASPAPKVFTTHDGPDTFSTDFTLVWEDGHSVHRMPLDPQNYKGLSGPYNRRNVFGAVLAYGPILQSNPTTQPMFDSVASYAMCPSGGAPILRELGLDPTEFRGIAIEFSPREGTPESVPRRVEIPCDGGEQ